MKYDLTRALVLLGISTLLNPDEIVLATLDLDIGVLRDVAAEPLVALREDFRNTTEQLAVVNEYLKELFPQALLTKSITG